MNYLKPSFSVPATGKAPAHCKHGWLDLKRSRCVMCGASVDCGPTGTPAWVRETEARLDGFKPDKQLTGWHSRDAGKHGREYMPSWVLDAAADRHYGPAAVADAMGLAMYGADGSHPDSAALIGDDPQRGYEP